MYADKTRNRINERRICYKIYENFRKLLLLGDRPKELTNREEQLLEYEKNYVFFL